MTTQDIIKALAIDDKEKNEILAMYSYVNESQRIAIDQLAWTCYFELFDAKLNENFNKRLMDVQKGKEKLTSDLYGEALQQTEQEMTTDFQQAISTANLEAARSAMKKIVDEIRAAQKKPN